MITRRHSAVGSTEYLIIVAIVLVLGMLAINLMGISIWSGPKNQISTSKAYWSTQAIPVKINDWKMLTVQDTDSEIVEVNLTLALSNPGREAITISGVRISPGDFRYVYDADGNFVGYADTLSMRLEAGAEKKIVIQQWSVGADAYVPPHIYELDVNFSYEGPTLVAAVKKSDMFAMTAAAMIGAIQKGKVPLMGENEYRKASLSGDCPPPMTMYNGECCPLADQCGSSCCVAPDGNGCAGGTCCAAGRIACGATCCGIGQTCSGGSCVTPGCNSPSIVCKVPGVTNWCCPAGGKCVDPAASSYESACTESGVACPIGTVDCNSNYCCPASADVTCTDAMPPCCNTTTSTVCAFTNATGSFTDCCASTESCNAASGCCRNVGTACDENNPCCDGSSCNGGACVLKTPVLCSAGGAYNPSDNICVDNCDTNIETCDANCVCQPKTPVACDGGLNDPNTQYCTLLGCPDGLNCDPSDCTCTTDVPIACGLGGMGPGFYCSPSTICEEMGDYYCQPSDCTCQPKTPVACNGGLNDPDTQYCSLLGCSGGLNCDPTICSCTDRTAVACGNPFDINLNYCDPTDTCPTDYYCQPSDCTCQPKTPVACGRGYGDPDTQYCSPTTCTGGLNCDPNICKCTDKTAVACGGSFTANNNFCDPKDTCIAPDVCDPITCGCECPIGESVCLGTEAGDVCCPAGQCMDTPGATYSHVCCGAAEEACATGYSGADKTYVCCAAGSCADTGAVAPNPAQICCDAASGPLCDVYGSGPMCCPNSKTCSDVTPAQWGYSGPSQMCCDTPNVCHTATYSEGSPVGDTFTCCAGDCADVSDGTTITQQCCGATDTLCAAGADSFYTDTPAGLAVQRENEICCPQPSTCIGVGGAYNDPVDPAPTSMCCGIGATVCRDPTYEQTPGGPWFPGHYTCCYGSCFGYNFQVDSLLPITPSGICCAATDKTVCRLDKGGEYGCCNGGCVDSPTQWDGGTESNGDPIVVDAQRPQTCCPPLSTVYISATSSGGPDGPAGPFGGYSPTFSCCPLGSTPADTDNVAAPQKCCPTGTVAGHSGSFGVANDCCAATDSVATKQVTDGVGRVLTSTLCCPAPLRALNDSSGELVCCNPGNVANVPAAPFCCATPVVPPGGVCGGSIGPHQCGVGDPLCNGMCSGGQVCVVEGLDCACNTPTTCADAIAPACAGTCGSGLTCKATAGQCFCDP